MLNSVICNILTELHTYYIFANISWEKRFANFNKQQVPCGLCPLSIHSMNPCVFRTFFCVVVVMHVIRRDLLVISRSNCATMQNSLYVTAWIRKRVTLLAGKHWLVALRRLSCHFPEGHLDVVGHFISQVMRLSCDLWSRNGWNGCVLT